MAKTSEAPEETVEIRPTTLVVESIGFQQVSVGLPLAKNQKSIQNVHGRIDWTDDEKGETIPVREGKKLTSFVSRMVHLLSI